MNSYLLQISLKEFSFLSKSFTQTANTLVRDLNAKHLSGYLACRQKKLPSTNLRHKIYSITFLYVFPVNFYIVISVQALMLMIKSKRVHKFMLYGFFSTVVTTLGENYLKNINFNKTERMFGDKTKLLILISRNLKTAVFLSAKYLLD